jgi:flavin-binding protein dodecin
MFSSPRPSLNPTKDGRIPHKSRLQGAAEIVRNIRSIYIEHFEAAVEKNKISKYRINAKISFALG